MKINLKTLGAALVLAAATNLTAHAAVLVTYGYPAQSSSADPVPVTITDAASITGSNDVGSGLDESNNGFYSGWQASAHGSYGTGGASFPQSLNDPMTGAMIDKTYYELTLAPVAGATMSLTDVDFTNTTFSYQLGSPSNYTVEVSTDNFATETTLMTYSISSGFGVAGTDLSLTGLTNLSTPVEFRIYLYGQQNNYFLAALQGSTVINGTVTPEPSTYALLLVGALALLGVHRRFSRSA